MKTIKKLLSLTLATIIMVSMLPAHAEETEESHGTGLQAMTEDRRNELMKHAITHTDDEPIKYSNVTSVDNSNTDYFPSIAIAHLLSLSSSDNLTYISVKFLITVTSYK